MSAARHSFPCNGSSVADTLIKANRQAFATPDIVLHGSVDHAMDKNFKFLRSQAEAMDKSLVAAWPREQRSDRPKFEMLKRAYVEARYSISTISARMISPGS
ncbi:MULTISPECIES: hypothetical protein [unclassified Brevundimonas]|uniref:hypothetical protein n=1 Tax=unclassified Brevundimonas TaxID=2622653 RepID=UPI001ADE5C6E|nr:MULTISPECIES: hypothetical protein [unclassified Brevundimonas]